MQRLLGAIAAIILLMALIACGRFSEEPAIFIAHNHHSDSATAIVDGNSIAEIGPNSVTNTEIQVQVSRNRVGSYGYGPSQIDKEVQVTVVFKNKRSGKLSREAWCTAGSKIKTLIVYEPQGFVSADGTDGYAYCSTLRTMGMSPQELERAIAAAKLEISIMAAKDRMAEAALKGGSQ